MQKHERSYGSLILGIAFFITGLLSINPAWLFGMLFWWCSPSYGFLLIIQAIFQENGTRQEFNFHPDTNQYQMVFKGMKTSHVTLTKVTSVLRDKPILRPLSKLDVFMIIYLIFVMVFQMSASTLLSIFSPSLLIDWAVFVLLMVGLYWYMHLPMSAILVTTTTSQRIFPIFSRKSSTRQFLPIYNKNRFLLFLLPAIFSVVCFLLFLF